MASSTKFRPFAKLIENNPRPFWAIDPDGRLVFLSAAVGTWLGIEPYQLLGRLCVAGASISDNPLDYLAASLSPPPGFLQRGTSSLLIQPVVKGLTVDGKPLSRPAALETRFLRIGEGAQSITVAACGEYADAAIDDTVETALRLRKQLDGWRRHHETFSETALIGSSRLSDRMRAQTKMARSFRGHVTIVEAPGSGAESVAMTLHQATAEDEPLAIVDGPLMDAELLDASLGTVLHHLQDSQTSRATIVLRGLDETPSEAQQRLVHWLQQYDDRLRLIALTRPANAPSVDNDRLTARWEEDQEMESIFPKLADHLCGLSIRLHALADRVDDIPMIATAMLDRRRAAGDGPADRISRPALDALVLYPWPDNLRELDQAIRHAIRNCRGEAIGLDHLPLAVRSYRPNEGIPLAEQSVDLDQAVARFENDLIRRMLEASDGNRAEAARRLNISRARLLRKLESST